MRRCITLLILPLLLAACGGESGSPAVGTIPLPAAQASAPDQCPTGDATAQLQAMIDGAKGKLELPACVFNVSQTLVIRKPLEFVGSGPNVFGTVIRSSANVGILLEPDVTISVADCGPSCRGWWAYFSAFRIEPAIVGQGGPDGHAMAWRLGKGRFISMSDIHRVYFGDFGGQGLHLDNSNGNANGFFTINVTRSWIENGVKGELVGDSVFFDANEIPDGRSRAGRGAPGFDITSVPGAAEQIYSRNNVSTTGGCFLIRNGIGTGIVNNWCESASAGQSLGLIQVTNCAECAVRDNRVQTMGGSAPYALVLDGSSLTVIDSNKLNVGKEGHMAFVNGARDNKMAGLNRFDGELAGKIAGASTGLIPN